MTLKGNFIHQSPWLFKYFHRICWKLISMPFICYTVAQYGGNSHRYHICIFMQTFTWINEVFCMSGFPFRRKSLFPRAHFQEHAENRALKQCLAAAAFPQRGSELAILNSFFLSISGAVQDPLSILNHMSMPVYPRQPYSLQQIHSLANDPLGTTFWNLLHHFQRRYSETCRRKGCTHLFSSLQI